MAKERVYADHEKRGIHGLDLANPGASDRVAMEVSGNPQVLREAREPTVSASYRKGGAVTPRKYFSDAHNYRRGSP
jgi:hypothetical protein